MLLRKGVYPYEYMDGWDKFNETLIPSKESFYSNLTMENISETDYRHANNIFKTFKLNNWGDYHDLYVQSDTLLLADVFENFRKKKLYGPFLWMGFNCLKARATSRRQFTFYH